MQIIRLSDGDFEPASHEDASNPGVLKRVIARRDDLLRGHMQMLNWARLPPGRAFRPHYHEDMQEVFIILNGTVSMIVNGDRLELQSGDTILIDPREVHDMRNDTSSPVDYIVFGLSTEEGGQTRVTGSERES